MNKTIHCSLLTCAGYTGENPALAKLDRPLGAIELLENSCTAVPACGLSAAAKVFSPVADDDASIIFAVDNGCNVPRHFDGIITISKEEEEEV